MSYIHPMVKSLVNLQQTIRDIGVLYTILVPSLVFIGTVLSIIIRMELYLIPEINY